MNNSTESAAIELMEKRTEALRLRKSGMTYPDIALRLGVAKETARSYVLGALEAFVEEPGEEVRKMEIMRLDSLLQAIWPMCMAGDLEAIDRALKIEQFRAKITGMMMPIKIDIELRIRDMAKTMGLNEDEAIAVAGEYVRMISAANAGS